MDQKAFMSWSGGKDSALSLYRAQKEHVPVQALVTTVNSATGRVSMHGVRRSLVDQQAQSLLLPLLTVDLPEMPGMEAYEGAMGKVHRQLKSGGYTHGVFGDVFLEDLKQYRQSLLGRENLECIFPLWKSGSREVMDDFLAQGFRAVVVCVNSAYLDKSFCGRLLDESFLNDLPAGTDVCGERGEYHSFVFDGPNFSRPVNYQTGEIVYNEYPAPKSADDCFGPPQPASGFYFCDLVPA